MDKELILITKVTVNGRFQDSQLYSGKFYLWNQQNELFVYDWNKWMKGLHEVERPIYLEPLPTEQLTFNLTELDPFLLRVFPFQEQVKDTAIFNSNLYYSTISGVYRLSLRKKEALPERIWTEPVLEMNLSSSGRMAWAAGESGLYEYLLTPHYHYPNQNLKVAKRIYQLSDTYTARTEWEKQDLVQYGEDYFKPKNILRFQERQGELRLTDVQSAHNLQGQSRTSIQQLPLRMPMSQPSMNDGYLFSFESESQIIRNTADYRERNLHLRKKQVIKDTDFDYSSDTVLIQENPNQLLLSIEGEPLLDIPKKPSAKWRIYSRTRHYQNQLHLLTEDQLTIYLFTEIKR